VCAHFLHMTFVVIREKPVAIQTFYVCILISFLAMVDVLSRIAEINFLFVIF
jgi:hypothetical protein